MLHFSFSYLSPLWHYFLFIYLSPSSSSSTFSCSFPFSPPYHSCMSLSPLFCSLPFPSTSSLLVHFPLFSHFSLELYSFSSSVSFYLILFPFPVFIFFTSVFIFYHCHLFCYSFPCSSHFHSLFSIFLYCLSTQALVSNMQPQYIYWINALLSMFIGKSNCFQYLYKTYLVILFMWNK